MIEYDHSANQHSIAGATAALPVLLTNGAIRSVLDVGCGRGMWLRALLDFGIEDVAGLDGVAIPADQLLVPQRYFHVQDLTRPWFLNRKFDATLCLEVAEHLAPEHASTLIDSIVRHTDLVFFSAAAPDQPGQHHVNCRWPDYWQGHFNRVGFVCSDAVRWTIWDDERIEPWYRQNLFCARRAPAEAGGERRIARVVHPAMSPFLAHAAAATARQTVLDQVTNGGMPPQWYVGAAVTAAMAKLQRQFAGKASKHSNAASA